MDDTQETQWFAICCLKLMPRHPGDLNYVQEPDLVNFFSYQHFSRAIHNSDNMGMIVSF
jgi:hypothetical protein